MEYPLVTIAIPAYKATFLKQAIESALAQTYQHIEVIVVDDDSPNPIQEIVKTINDSRVKYYRNEKNVGKDNPVHNWNKCLSHAQGEFFALLCDDDTYAPSFIEEMLKLANLFPNTNVFRTRADFVNEKGETIDWYPSSPLWESVDDYIWHVNRRYRKQTISEFMYRTAHIRKLGGYYPLPLAWYADYVSVFRFALDGGIASSSQLMMHFRQSGQNISSQDNKNSMAKLKAIKLYMSWLTDFVKENHLSKSQAHLYNLRHSMMIEQEYILENATKWTLLKALLHKKELMLHSCSIKKAL